MDTLAQKDKKYIIKILEKEYELSHINWTILSSIEEEFGCNITELIPILQKSLYKNTLSLIWILLRDKYPELTKESIGKITDNKEILLANESIGNILIDFFGDH
jgi:hypothetical protein